MDDFPEVFHTLIRDSKIYDSSCSKEARVVYIDKDNKPDIQVIPVPGDKYPVQLKNISSSNWTVETPSGKLKSVEANQTMPVKAGLKINLTGTTKGEII